MIPIGNETVLSAHH